MLSNAMYLLLTVVGGVPCDFIDSELSLFGPLADDGPADAKLRIGCPCLAAMLHGLSDGTAC